MLRFKPFVLLLVFLWAGSANAQHSTAACEAAAKKLYVKGTTEAQRTADFEIWSSASCIGFRKDRTIAFDELNKGNEDKARLVWKSEEEAYSSKCQTSVEKRWMEGGPKFRREQKMPELMDACMSQSKMLNTTKHFKPIYREIAETGKSVPHVRAIYEARKDAKKKEEELFFKEVTVHESDCVQWRQRNADLDWSQAKNCPKSNNEIAYAEPKTEEEYQSLLVKHDLVRQRFDRDLKAHAGACTGWGRKHDFSDAEIERRCLLAS